MGLGLPVKFSHFLPEVSRRYLPHTRQPEHFGAFQRDVAMGIVGPRARFAMKA